MNVKPRTLSEKILSRAAGREVSAGDIVIVDVDRCMSHDSLTPEVINVLDDVLEAEHVFDPQRVAVMVDHVAPASSVSTADAQVKVRDWVKREGIEDFYDVGAGVCHQVMLEEGLIQPGQVVLGTDSHATAYGAICAFGTGVGSRDMALALASGRIWLRVPQTIHVRLDGRFRRNVGAKDVSLLLCGRLGMNGANYRAVEFHGGDWLGLADRTTLCSMTTELGAKVGLFPPSGEVLNLFTVPGWLEVEEGATYERIIELDLDSLEPQVAVPSSVEHVRPVADLAGDIAVDQVFVGTCTNGRLRDLESVGRILEGNKIAPGVRMLIVPASHRTLREAVANGTMATLLDAGATMGTPGCGPCIGRHMGVLGAGDVCLSTGNRNFRGRMGSPDAQIYLGSPETAAATALTGVITDPTTV
ncbi:MAG: 3-isopropylmalate dehydratase large subunit [Anaerolineales bacterium]